MTDKLYVDAAEALVVAAGADENLGPEIQADPFDTIQGILDYSGTGTPRLDAIWKDAKGVTVATETGLGTVSSPLITFQAVVRAPRVQFQITETGSANPVTIDAASIVGAR
jgi:hypothetical protein